METLNTIKKAILDMRKECSKNTPFHSQLFHPLKLLKLFIKLIFVMLNSAVLQNFNLTLNVVAFSNFIYIEYIYVIYIKYRKIKKSPKIWMFGRVIITAFLHLSQPLC